MKAIGWIVTWAVIIFLFSPMAVIAVLSFNTAPRGTQWAGWTTEWYGKLFSHPGILESVSNSLRIALGASLLSLFFGLCVGWALVRGPRWLANVLEGITLIPVLLPEVIMGLSLLCFFVWFSVPQGLFAVAVAHSTFGAAYVALLVRARLITMDVLLEEAAADLGANRFRKLFRVLLPQLYPALLSGGLMSFVLSFDDFLVSYFVAGVGATTLPVKIYSMLKFGITPEMNALSVLIFAASSVLVGAALSLQRRRV